MKEFEGPRRSVLEELERLKVGHKERFQFGPLSINEQKALVQMLVESAQFQTHRNDPFPKNFLFVHVATIQ